ncbi:hypothetical protein J2Y41_000833 [Arthrobacter sp. 1088]|nr:hypothetical protein [Arthrobacter sp. 1088]
MKRITATPTFGGAPKGSSPVKVSSGVTCKATAWRTPPATGLRSESRGFGIQETSHQIWPDCRD